MHVWGIVVAAGSGVRFGGPKHEAEIAGKPLWQHARDVLLAGGCEGVVVVGDVDGGVAGGLRRQDSVAAGLAHIPPDVDAVLVHDAARPGASEALVAAVIDRLRDPNVDGVVPGLPSPTPSRSIATASLRPHCPVRRSSPCRPHRAFAPPCSGAAHLLPDDVTDDAELVERAGGVVVIVEGELNNFKLTYPADVERMRRLLELT